MKELIFGVVFLLFHFGLWAGTAYIVFWRGESGWWFVLTLLISLIFTQVSIK